MPRRYPRLHAKDREGNTVSIPLCIAPLLYAEEEFVSLSQRKVNEIAAANERVNSQEPRAAGELSPASASALPPAEGDVYKPDGEASSHENVGSSITGTVTPERSSASSSQTPVRDAPRENGRRKKRVRRLWTAQEDRIVKCAVLRNESGPSLIGRLPNRSRSAVLKRFYVLREKLRNEGRAARGVETEGGAAEVGDDGCGEGAEERIDDMAIDGVEDNDMDDEEGIGARGKEGGDGESLDEYESYDENGDAEVDEDVDEDGDDEAGARGIEDGYRPDEEMDEIPPLEQ